MIPPLYVLSTLTKKMNYVPEGPKWSPAICLSLTQKPREADAQEKPKEMNPEQSEEAPRMC